MEGRQKVIPAVEGLESKAEIRRAVILLAWPAITEMFLNTLVQFVDTAMVGSLGAVAIAAVGVSNSPMWMLMGIFAALGVGSTALVARHVGARQLEDANRTAQQSLFLGVLLALSVTLLIQLYGHLLPMAMGAEPEVIPEAASYLRIISMGFPLHFSMFILTGVLRGAGDTKTPMRVTALANVVNIALNFLLIFPTRELLLNLPFLPELAFTMPGAGLGVQGAALGTALARSLAGIIVLWVLFGGRRGVRISLFPLRFDGAIVRRILRIGLPASGERLIMSGGHMIFTIIVLGLGTAQYAAHHLAIVAESVSYMPGFGFSMAATTLVGQGLGAGKPKLAQTSGYITWQLGALTMCAMGVMFFVIPERLIMIFNRDPEIVRYGAMCLRMVALAQLPFSAAMVLTGGLRGAGDTVWPLIIAAIGMWPVRLGLALVFIHVFELGLFGAWLAMVIDLWVRGTITFFRFRSGRWQNIRV